jgi:uncharacterized protein
VSDHEPFEDEPTEPTAEIRFFPADLEVRAARAGGDGRTITGILVPWNVRMRIDDALEESFRAGAADRFLRMPNRVKLSRGHIKQGGSPFGKAVELRNDAKGLWGALRASKTDIGEETLTLVHDGVLEELSIAFRPRQNRDRGPAQGGGKWVERVKVDLLEVAVVPEGAYGRHAMVSEIRSAHPDIWTPRDEQQEQARELEDDEVRDAGRRPRLVAARARVALLPRRRVMIG